MSVVLEIFFLFLAGGLLLAYLLFRSDNIVFIYEGSLADLNRAMIHGKKVSLLCCIDGSEYRKEIKATPISIGLQNIIFECCREDNTKFERKISLSQIAFTD